MKKALTALLITVLAGGLFMPVLAQEVPENTLSEQTPIVPPEPVTQIEPVLPQEEEAEEPVPVTSEETATSTEPVTIEETAVLPVASTTADLVEETVEIIVKFKEREANINLSSGRREVAGVVEATGTTGEERLPEANSVVLTVPLDESVEAIIERIERDSSVEYAEPNYARSMQVLTPDDTRFNDQWGLVNTGQTLSEVNTTGTDDVDIDAPEAWDLSLGTSTIVAVIDTGVLYTHTDLSNQMWDGSACVSETGGSLGGCMHGYDFEDDDLIPLPNATTTTDTYHGTHVAGIIAAELNNATGTVGVAPSTKIMALKFGLDVASGVRAIDFAIQNGAKIINASYGGTEFSQTEYDAIARFEAAGGIFIAAAGNGSGSPATGKDNDSVPTFPASYNLPNIVSVVATGQNDELATFSNFGTSTTDIGAPGRRILSTIALDGVTESYAYQSGTSMAAPHVSGTAALLRSLYFPASSATSSVKAMKSALLNSGETIESLSGKTASGKRLNAFNALEYLAEDLVAPVITLIGPSSVSLTVGDTYNDEGATAVDDIDVSVAVVTTSTVTTSTTGTYTVTYTASDQAGNEATPVIRTVTVSAAPVVEETPRRRSGGGGGGGSRTSTPSSANPTRELFTAPATGPYASMTIEQRAALLKVLVELLTKLQAQLAILRAQGL